MHAQKLANLVALGRHHKATKVILKTVKFIGVGNNKKLLQNSKHKFNRINALNH